ncbi:porin family protein [Riemerella anatipestifer]|uniref:Porin family protein n=1 Tax=Riemerella anatipestifer TaxID=34085 RepID=A0AAP6HH04_RIEAN|nr:porin family protein [Riemerella anatipestifer]MCD5968199.1 PorT family protein [Riemerella anatipestifer]MCU7541002.1 PorT family protein [Riemerella anatipestifer]MCU7570840.1 PorT family protein [Riemerella anatipestifer]MCU7598320.1 PorT family protein [Riemerella anatipestifer]MCW0495258.1 PorT family protein [Riemerella anatipestifer]
MKKIVLAGLVLVSSLSFAQINIQFENTRFGVSGGVNYSGVKHAHNPSGKRLGFQVGALALIPADNEDQFYLQPEVQYYQAGETGYNKQVGDKNTKYYNDYISVPIYVKGYFSEAESEFFGLFGPRFNFLIKQTVESPSRQVYTIEGNDPRYPNLNGKASSFNFGLGVGLGFSYKRQLEVALKYDLGLSNTYRHMVESYTGDLSTEKKKSEQVLSLTLNYIFE